MGSPGRAIESSQARDERRAGQELSEARKEREFKRRITKPIRTVRHGRHRPDRPRRQFSGTNAAGRERSTPATGSFPAASASPANPRWRPCSRECLEETGLRVDGRTPQAHHAPPLSARAGGAAFLRLHARMTRRPSPPSRRAFAGYTPGSWPPYASRKPTRRSSSSSRGRASCRAELLGRLSAKQFVRRSSGNRVGMQGNRRLAIDDLIDQTVFAGFLG